MMRRDWTRDELNAMGAAYYGGLHANDYSGPWETLPDYQRAKHRRGVRALLDALERIEAEHLARHKRESCNTIAVRRVG